MALTATKDSDDGNLRTSHAYFMTALDIIDERSLSLSDATQVGNHHLPKPTPAIFALRSIDSQLATPTGDKSFGSQFLDAQVHELGTENIVPPRIVSAGRSTPDRPTTLRGHWGRCTAGRLLA